MNRLAPWLIVAVFLSVGLVSCCVCNAQAIDFKVDGPSHVGEGEYVELTVLFPEGVKADVDFVPVEETDFGVHPVVSESLVDGKLTASVVGRKCTFSARCMGERDIIVVATAFANFDGVPRLKSLKHRIAVKANKAPNPPPAPQPPPLPVPPNDDDFGPTVPIPSATLPKSDIEKITLILDNVVTRLEAIEKKATQVAVTAPAPDPSQATPATVALAEALTKEFRRIESKGTVPVVVKPAAVATAVDVRPGHWSVGSDWNPSKAEAIAHLRAAHSAKARQHEPLENLSLETILTLHDDSHEGRASTVRASTVVSAPAPAARSALPASPCPGGVCPTTSRSVSYGRGLFRWGR